MMQRVRSRDLPFHIQSQSMGVKSGTIATAHAGFVQILHNSARRMTFLSHDRAARGHQQMCLDNQAVLHTSDMEFLTNGTCVKYFWARVKFSSINVKNYPICEICRIQA